MKIPEELSSLYSNTANKLENIQNDPRGKLRAFLDPHVQKYADASPLEKWSREKTRDLYGLGPVGNRAKEMMIGTGEQANELFNQRSQYTKDAREGYSRVWDKANELYDTENNADLQASREATERLGDISRKTVNASADEIAKDAALVASQEAFNKTVMPQIMNNYAAMGLGRSTKAGGAAADAWAKEATPHIQEAIARQERAIDREYKGAADQAGQYLNIGSQGMEGKVAALGSLGNTTAGVAGLGAQDDARRAQALGLKQGTAGQLADYATSDWSARKGAIDEGMAVGGVFRGIEDARNKAAYDDFLRRQGIAEQSLFVPFGGANAMITPRGK